MRRERLRNRILRRLHGPTPVVHDPAYRLPLPSFETRTGLDPRRADAALEYLLAAGAVRAQDVRTPPRITYEELLLVHSAGHLDSLSRPEVLARVFAADESELVVDEVLRTVRLACGGTLLATREALARKGPAFNLLGGFHHAGRSRAGGSCPVNDVAVAVAVLRREGFAGRVAVIDLDAHPPDGTADCLAGDPEVWIGSLSASAWEALPGVDDVVLPRGCDDARYHAELEALLGRMPRPALAFVLAGGDVLAGDDLGGLSLTLAGVRARDLTVARTLARVPSVWLPAGGYHADAWRVLAGSVLAAALRSARPVEAGFDPLHERFSRVYGDLRASDLGSGDELDLADIEAELGGRPRQHRLLGFYSAEGLEWGFARYGILEQLRRLGYDRLRVVLDGTGAGDRLRLLGTAGDAEHLLIECEVARRHLAGDDYLFVNWLTLRNPRARFDRGRVALPGQDAPGLGLAREAGELLRHMALRLGLAGVAFVPAHYHVAFAARHQFRFADPARQGRFEAMVRDLGGLPLLPATTAVAAGRVRMDGAPYAWEADEMVFRPEGAVPADPVTDREREARRFTVQAPSGT